MFTAILFAIIGVKCNLGVAYWIVFGVYSFLTIVKTVINIIEKIHKTKIKRLKKKAREEAVTPFFKEEKTVI